MDSFDLRKYLGTNPNSPIPDKWEIEQMDKDLGELWFSLFNAWKIASNLKDSEDYSYEWLVGWLEEQFNGVDQIKDILQKYVYPNLK